MINIANLIHTQENIRSIDTIFFFKELFDKGLSLEGYPVQIRLIGDKYYLHDGLHRMLTCMYYGIGILREGEYVLHEMTYQDYDTANPERGWFTPLDIIRKVRSTSFMKHKTNLQKIYEKCGVDMFEHHLRMIRPSQRPWEALRHYANIGDMYEDKLL